MKEILRKLLNKKKPTEPIASDTSPSPDLDIRAIEEPTTKVQRNHLTDEHKAFLIWEIVYTGRNKEICKNFKERFGFDVHTNLVNHYKRSKKYQPAIREVQEEFERSMPESYLASKKQRVVLMTEIYEKALEKQDLKLAKECIQVVDDMVDKSSKRFGNLSFFHFEQKNQYADMTLQDIRKKKLELWEKLERVKINSEGNTNALSLEKEEKET